MNSRDVAHTATSSSWAAATATVWIQLDSKVAIILPMILELWASSVEGVNHIDVLPEWNCIMIWSSFGKASLAYKLSANSGRGPSCCVSIGDSCGRVVTCTVYVNLNATRAVCFPYYHISLWHWSTIPKGKVTILWNCTDVLDWFGRGIVCDLWRSTVG